MMEALSVGWGVDIISVTARENDREHKIKGVLRSTLLVVVVAGGGLE